jgi:hypothetical protein
MSSFVVGERVVSRCEGGLLEVEYCLFEPGDVVLSEGDDGELGEHGYLTSARLARERLLDRGIDARLTDDAFAALRDGHRRLLARTPDVLRIIDHLGPYEAFEGGVFRAAAGRYAGAWLDLDALARACPLRGTARLLQAMHLLLVLEEIHEDTPVRLLTENATRGRGPELRTWRRQALPPPDRLPAVLRALRGPARARSRPDSATVCDELLSNVRARATVATSWARRPLALEAMLAREVAARAATPPLLAEDAASERIDDTSRDADLLQGEDSVPTALPSIPVPLTRLREPPTMPRLRAATLIVPVAEVEEPAADHAVAVDAPAVSKPHRAAVCQPLTLAKAPVSSRPPASLVRARRMSHRELVETLEPPAQSDPTRQATTRLARELGRDYRRLYGTRLVADVTAIDTMQRHLRHRFSGARLDDRRSPELEAELLRHGALLSEVLARTLGAEWVDVSGQPDDWAMIVPGAGVRGRVEPIARLRRFVLRGRHEPDLVAFYADLEDASLMAS